MEKHLHIVCHDIPYPANYGGVIDVFCKIQVLSQAGILIHLHCFRYGNRGPQPELEQYCASVHYYARKKKLSGTLPYIISSRKNPDLLNNLLKDDHPILLESLHCSWPVMDKRFRGRKMVLRLQNVEWEYYRGLALSTRNWWKKLYYTVESRLLRRYEACIANKVTILTIGAADEQYYRDHFGATHISYLPAFVPYNQATPPEGKGSFCLYHGNLSVPENEIAAAWLLQFVFSQVDVPFVIAGRNPSRKLEQLALRNTNTCIAANPSEREMLDLITKAQVNILPAFNDTGVKLKVLESLYRGRFCITNANAQRGFRDNGLLVIANDAHDMQQCIRNCFEKTFTGEAVAERRDKLDHEFNNRENADRLIAYLW